MTEDNEFRFQQLEGGAPGKTQAAIPTGGVTPSQPLSPDPTQTADGCRRRSGSAGCAACPGDVPMDLDPRRLQDPLLGGGS